MFIFPRNFVDAVESCFYQQLIGNRKKWNLILNCFFFFFEGKGRKYGKSQWSLSRPVVSIAIAATAHLPSLHVLDGKIITMTTSAFKDAIMGYWSCSAFADSHLRNWNVF